MNRTRLPNAVLSFLIIFSFYFTPVSSSKTTLPRLPTGLAARPASLPEIAPNSLTLNAPSVFANEKASYFTIANGLLYWSKVCPSGDIDTPGYYLRRLPTLGGARSTVAVSEWPLCDLFHYPTPDPTGVYVFNLEANQIDFYSTLDPTHPPVNVRSLAANELPNGQVLQDETHLYWLASGGRILRFSKADYTLSPFVLTEAGPDDLALSSESVYWMDDQGLWQAPKNCSSLPCSSKTNLAAANGKDMLYSPVSYRPVTGLSSNLSIWWVENGSPQTLKAYGCYLIGACFTRTMYTAPLTDTTLSRPAIGRCEDGSTCLFWKEHNITAWTSRLQRKSLYDSAETIASTSFDTGTTVLANQNGVYFSTDAYQIAFLPYNASALQADLALPAWEVTQAIQSPLNDVPLVAEKETYVRVWGQQISGDPTSGVGVLLYGWRNGQPLPGSPLSPLDLYQYLQTGAGYNRGDPKDGWVFHLPSSWTAAGTTRLRAVIDPWEMYPDPSRSNNERLGDLTFTAQARACTVLAPVRTHTPPASIYSPHFWDIIDLYKRLWPVPGVRVYTQSQDFAELEACTWHGVPYPCYGPYELDQGASWWPPSLSDSDNLMISIYNRYLFSDDPDECDQDGGAVHYIGMVHPEAPTGNANGMGYLYGPASWVKLQLPQSTPGNRWTWPNAGVTLAHELTHNYNRLHVNCGNPADVDANFPAENDCMFDNPGPNAHYGFDPNSLAPIPPETASDYMSYSGIGYSPTWQGRWVSDYTWKALFPKMQLHTQASAGLTVNDLSLSSDMPVVWASGSLDSTGQQGSLAYAWQYPGASLSTGQMEKLQAVSSPAVMASASQAGYSLRLLNAASVVLDERAVTVNKLSTGDAGYFFSLAFPAPAGQVARMELLSGGSVLASLAPGTAQPQVSITQPTGGASVGANLVVSWQAFDPDPGDRLLFNVQYSPDRGASWRTVASGYPASVGKKTVSLTLHDLEGSSGNNALVRVAASDGYHTTLATSPFFSVQDQPPQPYIASPTEGQIYQAGEPVMLSGGAQDAESGSLSGNDLQWSLAGEVVGSGENVQISGLAPGNYPVTLVANDSAHQAETATNTLKIVPLEIPLLATAPSLNGLCEDPVYAQAVHLPLSPFGDGTQASAAILRNGQSLWVCFTGLLRSPSPTLLWDAGVHIDVDNSKDNFAQSTDYGFLVGEDGTPQTHSGNGSGGFSNTGPGGLLAQVASAGGRWSAEMQIEAAAVGGWEHMARLAVFSRRNNELARWPFAAAFAVPATWAETALNDLPILTGLNPQRTTVGSSGLKLTLTGEGFTPGATVYLAGSPLNTTWQSATQLTASVPASSLAVANTKAVTVENPGLDGYYSNELMLTIENPQPEISGFTLNRTASGGMLAIHGRNFVSGATVLWNGESRPATFTNSSEMQIALTAADLALGRTVGVTVINPTPGGMATRSFVVQQPLIYLPVVQR